MVAPPIEKHIPLLLAIYTQYSTSTLYRPILLNVSQGKTQKQLLVRAYSIRFIF